MAIRARSDGLRVNGTSNWRQNGRSSTEHQGPILARRERLICQGACSASQLSYFSKTRPSRWICGQVLAEACSSPEILYRDWNSFPPLKLKHVRVPWEAIGLLTDAMPAPRSNAEQIGSSPSAV